MSKFREWLYKWLPAEIKNDYIKNYKKLETVNLKLSQENRELRAYIEGAQDVLRSRAKVYIQNEVNK